MVKVVRELVVGVKAVKEAVKAVGVGNHTV
jgi:hypothetical protein